MTNPLATNANVPTSSDTVFHLRVTKNGVPVDKQVPRTYQYYTGTGGTILYDGSSEIRINGSGLTTPLIVQFGPINNIRNWIGRTVNINIYTPNSRTITLNSSPALMCVNGTLLTQLSHVIAASTTCKTLTLYFSDTTLLNLDYGASSLGSIVPFPVKTSNLAISYVYGTDSVFSLPCVRILDSNSYDVTINNLEPTLEGTIIPYVSSVSGPGTQFINVGFNPAPRRISSTNITGYLTSLGEQEAGFTISAYPILSNVFDKEYFTGSNTDGSLSMYDPLVDLGGIPKTFDANGSQVQLPGDVGPIAIDLADSLVFYVVNSSPTIIRWKSYTTYNEGDLLNLSTLVTALWTTGTTIVDIDFDDKTSSLLVLPNIPTTGKILSIPIRPYLNSDPNTVKTGVLFGATLTLPVGTVLYSMAICPFTRQIYIGCKPPLFTNSVYKFSPFPALAGPFSYQHPSISLDRLSITFSSQGTFFMLFERTLEVYQVNNTRGLSTNPMDTTVIYTIPQYHQSLSRNCYGWYQQ